MRSNREVAPLLDVMGCDPTGQQLEIAEFIQPVYVLDQAEFGLHNQRTIRQFVTVVPSVSAADTSAFQFISRNGLWVRRAISQSTNINWIIQGTQASFSTFDGAGNQAVTVAPLGSPIGNNPPTLVTGFPLSTFVAGNSGGFPALFSFVAKGRVNPATLPGVGTFWPGNTGLPFLQDVWIPPGFGIYMEATSLNVAFIMTLELEFPASTFITK